MTRRVVAGAKAEEDATLELSLRPRRLVEYVGQNNVKENLEVAIQAARQRGERAKNYLVKERGLPETRIVVVNGGHRDKRTVELFIVPLGAYPPTATPK